MLSVIIICKNEEANLHRCLTSVQWADEIIVLDSGSTDNSLTIAKEFTDKVYTNPDWQGYGIQKQRALEYATGTWVLNLDADEAVSHDLREEICAAMQQNTADAYYLRIALHFYGRALSYSWSPQKVLRLFKRLGARYKDNIVHEKVTLPSHAKLAHLKHPIIHHCIRDITHALYKLNKYSSLSASMRKTENRSSSLTKSLCSAGWMFFRCYILKRGFLEGRDGFILAILSAEGSFYRGIKTLYPDAT